MTHPLPLNAEVVMKCWLGGGHAEPARVLVRDDLHGSRRAAPRRRAAAGKVYRLGVLIPGVPAPTSPAGEAFWQGMRDLGWIEGQNLIVERRWAEGTWERLR
jgi:hypothetical protein